MSLLSGFNVSISEVSLLAAASNAAFNGRPVPAGWGIVQPQQLGLGASFWDGNYFTNSGASAIVLKSGDAWIVSFRGTDGLNDVARYPELFFHDYVNHFSPLLAALAAQVPATAQLYVTGASLGGAAANELADIAASQFGGRFATAKFVAFASPEITGANGIANVGFENDPVFRVLNGYRDSASSLDNLVLATSAYESGNYDGQHPFDGYAHDAAGGFEALTRVGQSSFLDLMTPDSLVIIDATDSIVTDVTPGREAIGAFYIGQAVNDRITGRAGDDHIEGFAGNDMLTGGGGNDVIDGGAGRDVAVYTSARGQAAVSVTATGAPFDHTVATPTDGADTLKGIEIIQFTDGRLVYDVTDPSAIVLRLYDAAFDRAPDPTGLHFWTGALTSGQNELPVAALFLSSTEFQVKFGSPDNQTFVQELYQNVLGRAGDTVGLAYWTQTLGTGALTRAGLLVSFAESSEDIAATRAVVEVGLWDPGAPALVA